MTAGFFLSVIASEAKQSIATRMRTDGLLRRFAPRNDGEGLRRLEKTLRIDVDLELEIALRLRPRRKPVPQIIRQIETARGFEQQTESVAALDDRKRRLRRPQHLDPLVERRHRCQLARKAFRGRPISRRNDP